MTDEPRPLMTARGPDPFPVPLRLRVLVVDDNRDAADTLAQLLTVCGAEAEVRYDGRTALEAVGAFAPDACILDLTMPGMGGCELAERIKNLGPPPLMVALTALGDDNARERTSLSGFDLHLVKPVDPAKLLNLLGKHAATR